MNRILDMISSISSGKTPKINPTLIYNEGWMTRLLVDFSVRRELKIKGIDFNDLGNWTSEALISSPFINAPHLREGYTHVDIALGDFDIDYKKRGELIVKSTANKFGVIEAKMGSDLSKGTKNAQKYNQATRNVVCIAKNVLDKSCTPFFIVAAPEKSILRYSINKKLEKNIILDELNNRVSSFDSSFRAKERIDEIEDIIGSMSIFSLSYEEWIDEFKLNDRKELSSFYRESKIWNRI